MASCRRSKETLQTKAKMGLSVSSLLACLKKKKKPPLPLFPSLPDDIVLNILSRISRVHHPSLSLVSKSFKSLLASPELEATRRNLQGKQPEDDCIYAFLKIPQKYNPFPKYCWYSVGPNHKSIAIHSFPDTHPAFPSIVPMGSEIYIIGGFFSNGGRSKKVYLLDCKSHQWRILPEMQTPRGTSAAGLLNGKIYIVGGSESTNEENWGEVYDPRNQTWTRLQTTIPDLSIRKTFAPDVVVESDQRVYIHETKFCLFVKDNIMCKVSNACDCLLWCDLKETLVWRKIQGLGLPKISNFISIASDLGGRGLTVWWSFWLGEHYDEFRTEIWCAHISIERRGVDEVWGTVKWSKVLFSIDESEIFFRKTVFYSVILTH